MSYSSFLSVHPSALQTWVKGISQSVSHQVKGQDGEHDSHAAIISCIFGGLLGAFAGYYGKTADNVIMRIMDILLAIPSMLLAIAIVAALGTSITNVLIAIAISYVPTFARTVRASVLTVKDQMATVPINSEYRTAHSMRSSMSLPNSSSPKRCIRLGP